MSCIITLYFLGRCTELRHSCSRSYEARESPIGIYYRVIDTPGVQYHYAAEWFHSF